MVVLLAVAFRLTLSSRLVEEARSEAERGVPGRMEGHGAMDMSVTDGPLLRRVFSGRAYTSISHYFFMNVYSLWFDLLLGFLIAGALGAWVPDAFWSKLFLPGHGLGTAVWDALIGPVIAMLSFVCSVGNVPLAAVLWRGGIGFGGAIAFIFGDLIILPIVDIYRRYYGRRVSLYLLGVSFATMALAGLLVGGVFELLHATPTNRDVRVFDTTLTFDHDTVLNIVVLLVAAVLGVRFLRTGGVAMLREMERPPQEGDTTGRDPVCGMSVDPSTAREHAEFEGTRYHFCSAGCRGAFERDPVRYLDGGAGAAAAGHRHPG